MANLIYASINGNKQGLISSGCGTHLSIGNKYQQGHEDEIFIYDLISYLEHHDNLSLHPLEIRKPIDKSSPLLAMSLSNHEVLQCEFVFYRISESGGIEKYFVIKLRDARIVELKLSAPHSMTQNDMPPQESVSFKYACIEWEHCKAGTSAYCLW
ncbi:type VI secretion system tube protein Hcp [Brenneria roseae subsp. americana]|uniref:Type VI secretion system tube protein Hcp n=1 Tax=Brenneria roseae subsp. americana TaxID=1508507 RepID=A0A2U1U2A3_9GAMM|nr:Hcp family type VI secretion system effector [Brenneria roseae]PWC15806.1 type VI secretion system tube protein Hcp [Brenneria roseae subsp. americana]PWC21660.1 type VI secretion system tube protein Hcp [Brenneria roseae subsp. roseae]